MNGPGVLFLAFFAGLVSFLSPCTLPLLPGYLSYISGLTVEEIREGQGTSTVVGTSVLFVLGFALVFVATGATASYIGAALQPHRILLTRVAAVFIILMALVMMGVIRVPALYQEKRFQLGRELGMWSAFPLGIAFGFAWQPCIGPTLASILLYASTEGSVQKGALLLFVYAVGLGVPFLLVALFAERMFESLNWFKRHYQALNRVGGAILLLMGVFVLLDRWQVVLGPLMTWYAQHTPS